MDFADIETAQGRRPMTGFALRHRQLFSWSNAGSALGEFHLEVKVVMSSLLKHMGGDLCV